MISLKVFELKRNYVCGFKVMRNQIVASFYNFHLEEDSNFNLFKWCIYLNFHSSERIRMHMREYYIIVT